MDDIRGSSKRALPIKRIYCVSEARIEIISPSYSLLNATTTTPRAVSKLSSEDSFVLSFEISKALSNDNDDESSSCKSSNSDSIDDSHRFKLLLHPSPNLLHPEAKISYHSLDQNSRKTIVSSNRLESQDVMAYSGWSLVPEEIGRWLSEKRSFEDHPPDWSRGVYDASIIGWARILVHQVIGMRSADDLDNLVLDGTFETDGRLWHIRSADSYLRLRSSAEPGLRRSTSHPRGGLIAWVDKEVDGSDYTTATTTSSSSSSSKTFSVKSTSSSSVSFNLTSNETPLVFESHPDPKFRTVAGPDSYSFQKNAEPSQFDYYSDYPDQQQQQLSSTEAGRGNDSPSQSTTTASQQYTRLVRRQSLGNDIGGGSSSSNFASSIGSTEGCPSSPKVIYMGIAVDCTFVKRYGSQDAARLAVLNDVNTASAVYQKSFNISLALIDLIIQNGTCPESPAPEAAWNADCPDNSAKGLSLNERLSEFSKWRASRGGGDGAGLWHLMTDCADGNEVGVAWLGSLCRADAESGLRGETTSGTGVTAATPNEWQVMAHEIAHNFGAIHDCDSGCTSSGGCCPFSQTSCNPDSDYIMAATATSSISNFSPCSIGNICSLLGKGGDKLDSSCLSEPNKHFTLKLNQCGNGILEPGEDCDPGMVSSPCCQWGTCKFATGAVCDPKHSSCCTQTCQYAPTGTICRPVSDPNCDVAESCPGNSAECPVDKFMDNGSKCGATGAGLSCAAGVCTSRDEQCKIAGKRLGLTKACDPSATMDCRITCQDPKSQSSCVVLESKFSAGSPCGCGGWCSKEGKCIGGAKAGCGDSWREERPGGTF
ncbi:Disintegrin-like metalloprotease [Phakopsora pachyrhizi]|uniref:Disintegrin and metalloproteinase domain-containing protein B n=1 Tax=Phakopsora pachyrhizi TaxID=170000 RepID=A0AAV0ANF3_PHAPC|nr:Disintegrin-like metalloprotease [Phakopsora pachyrhizi]